MDTLKVQEPYRDTPDDLEKGCTETQPPPVHSESCQVCSVQSAPTRGRRSFLKHPWIVLGAVALVWLVFSHGKRAFKFCRSGNAWSWAAGNKVEDASLAEGNVYQCVGSTNWTSYYDQPSWASDYPYGAQTGFSLPLQDALYLVSRGPFQHGQVKIEQSSKAADTVDVRVRVAYYGDEAFERATVCQMEREDNEYGVGIFTHPIAFHPPHPPRLPHPPPRTHEDRLRFDVTLILPAGNEAPLSVKKLETEMPSYSQNVADLQKSVLFDKISLTSVNGQLNVQSVAFEAGKFSSLNGEIDGHFVAQSSLDLHTVNGAITPTVNLLHRESEDSPKLSIHTTNGEIDAQVSLTSETLVGGEFKVDAKSVNGNIGVKFTDTPVDSVLFGGVETTVGEVEVELDSAFEGSYSLQSMLGKKVLSQHDVEDPSGKGRQRVVSRKEKVGRVDGELRWVEKDGSSSENEGYVVLKALVSSIQLIV